MRPKTVEFVETMIRSTTCSVLRRHHLSLRPQYIRRARLIFFQPGGWTTVVQRMRVNDAGQENGWLELIVRVDGQSKINISGLVLGFSEAG
jgi:Polysaccharide lyase 14